MTESFPKREMYVLTSQIIRAAISIPANIAEGFRKRSKRDTHRYMEIAHSSLEECRYYLILVSDLGYSNITELDQLLTEISRMLYSYKAALRADMQ